MKKALVTLLIILSTHSTYAQKIKIACIGNSITYGSGIANQEKNSYPAQLQVYLGDSYDVRNFGASGRTVLHKGDYPYIESEEYTESLNFEPDIVLIKLGTNDSKPQNIRYITDLKSDLLQLIRDYRSLTSNPRIIVLTPLRCFLTNELINDETIQKEIVPIIQEIAYEQDLEIIDMYYLFGDEYDVTFLPDRLHPSSIGAGVIAKHLHQKLTVSETTPLYFNLKSIPREFNFYGYKGLEYTVHGHKQLIVVPKKPSVGYPWVVRARFWGHEPQTDIALLEQGFHITYCDVSDMYGSDKAVKRWSKFYEEMTSIGLNKKVVLEGMSRGGLIVYNWAAENTDKVACIYADAPVLDIKSWPLGHYSNNKSNGDVEQLLKAYSFKNEKQIEKWDKNPIDHVAQLAKSRIPILHVVGEVDDIVPPRENTDLFASTMEDLGHPVKVIRKAGVGHHPHSLNNPDKIVRFILESTKLEQNYCVLPVCGNEFRSAAGWKEGADWHKVSEDITETLKGKQLDILLLGNSITQGFGGTRELVTYKPALELANEIFGDKKWESAGISGDRTQNLLWRIQNGNYNACNPKYVVITIGINNLIGGEDTPEFVVEGIVKIVEESKAQFPNSKIILFGLLPSGANKTDEIRHKCDVIHSYLSKLEWADVKYVNPTSWFVNTDGSLKTELYGGDYLHLVGKGYRVWCEQINRLIECP